MDPKLTMLFFLFGTIIGLSHLNYENLTKMKRGFDFSRAVHAVRRNKREGLCVPNT